MTIPNQLTLLRIILIPVFVLVFYYPFKWNNLFACLIFTLAALTDILDGYLARKLNQTSSLGAFLDPVADKLMVAIALVLLVQQNPTVYLALPAAIIIGREITVSALREWMAEIGERAVVNVSSYGKLKTAAQMAAILILLVYPGQTDNVFVIIGFVLLYVAVVLTVYSMWLYLKAGYYAAFRSEES